MRLAEKLLKQMLFKGLNGQKLARLSGVSDSEVSRILGGKSQPGLANAHRISRALGVSLDYLADDGLEVDPCSIQVAEPDRELLELAGHLGQRSARRILEMAADLGPEVAIRRLLGVEGRPLIEVGEGPTGRSTEPTPHPKSRASLG